MEKIIEKICTVLGLGMGIFSGGLLILGMISSSV